MTSATTFSTRTGSPSTTGTVSICPAYPGSLTIWRATGTAMSSRKTRVRAASATRTCDWVVSTVTWTASFSHAPWSIGAR